MACCLRRAHDQAAVLDPLGADQPVRQLLHLFGLAAKHDDLETTFVIEMSVQRRNDDVVMLMLEGSQFLGEKTGVVIVNQGDRAHDEGVRGDHYRVARRSRIKSRRASERFS